MLRSGVVGNPEVLGHIADRSFPFFVDVLQNADHLVADRFVIGIMQIIINIRPLFV